MRQFTWWRRFHSPLKLPNHMLFKGASELLHRIEFGEYEFNHLGTEAHLEPLIYDYMFDKIKAESP